MPRDKKPSKSVASTKHAGKTRTNNPPAEMEALVEKEESQPISAYYGRNKDLDPQLMWKGKDEENQEDLHVEALPIYVQEKIHPEAIVADLMRQTQLRRRQQPNKPRDLWKDDFNGILEDAARVEFYRHSQKWTNRMILGDSLSVMTSLAHKEMLKGKVQCIYIDPPYGIKFASNWQASTKSTSVGDRDATREPEMIQAFRDTWKKGIHSYLSYLRDRLIVARDLLSESGSVFVQIGDENVHLVRCLMDEVFRSENYINQIAYKVTSGFEKKVGNRRVENYIIWYAKNEKVCKFNRIYKEKSIDNIDFGLYKYVDDGVVTKKLKAKDGIDDIANKRIFRTLPLHTMGNAKRWERVFQSEKYNPPKNTQWRHTEKMYNEIVMAGRVMKEGKNIVSKYYIDDFQFEEYTNFWDDTGPETNKKYVVQTSEKVIQRCILMTTDPGDLVLDPTCGSGTTATVAEKWGRRWITIDTSRVALAVARARLMGNKYDYYIMRDSKEGAEHQNPSAAKKQYTNNVQYGFVYKRVPHVTLASIANNPNVGVIYEKWQEKILPLQEAFNKAVGKKREEWEIPLIAGDESSDEAKTAHKKWLAAKRQRQQEIDASIARNAPMESLVDSPMVDNSVVRVTGPFTVESLSPHRVLPTDEEDELLLAASDEEAKQEGIEPPALRSRRLRPKSQTDNEAKFMDVIYDNLKTAGVENTRKKERLMFDEIQPWQGGRYIQFCARYVEGGKNKKAAICVGPEYGTVTRSFMIAAAREAAEATSKFDMLIIMGFAFEANANVQSRGKNDVAKIGNMPALRVRLNNDLHMANYLKEKKGANLFVVFGEPDIEMRDRADDMLEVEIKGVDIFDPTTGKTKHSEIDDIACWMIDTNYNEESFIARHIYFTGGVADPYKKVKAALKAEIDEEDWAMLYSPVSRPFPPPQTGRIAVKAINHYGDEVIKTFETKGKK